jgi:nucleoside-diphosphate-sugar epimerase
MVLVTGGSGFLGKEVVKLLINVYKEPVRCLVRPGTSDEVFRELFQGKLPETLELFPGSFNDNDLLIKSLDGIDTVIHLAASLKGAHASQVANTVVGSENLFKACCEQNIKRFVLCSSFGVIGATQVPRRGLIDETVSIEEHPEWRDPYSFTKFMQEQVAWQMYKENGLPLVVVRPGVIFGSPASILTSRIGLTVFGLFIHLGGRNRIPLTYKENCADLIIKASKVPGVEGETFCAVDDDLPTSRYLLRRYKKQVSQIKSLSIHYFLLRQIAKLNVWYSNRTNGHLPAVFTPYKVDASWKGHRFSNKKAKEKLGWYPHVSMKEALDITFRSLKKINEKPII